MKIYLQPNMLFGFFISIAVVLGLAFTSYLYFNKMMAVTQWAAHARRVLYHSEQVRSFSSDIETAQKGYGLTGNELFLGPYRKTIEGIHTQIRELDSLPSDNPPKHPKM